MNNEYQQLRDMIRHEYERLNEQSTVPIDPACLSDTVYGQIDPQEVAPMLAKYSALMHLRQLTREVCRERYKFHEEESENRSQGNFFELQPRYPVTREDREVYIPRLEMSYQERLENINRLRTEARSKNKHADALQAETDRLVRSGELSPMDNPQSGAA